MKRQDFEELKSLTVQELEQKRTDIARQLFDQRIQVQLGQLKNTRILRNLRRDIARINTIIQLKKISKQRGANGSETRK
ncbi:MAG TPA: 50S ribosomal protein L29 [bacterium]|nr:50S ribosomal protein L29 [bacterium]HOL49382.1 50S ribosomal protein L29 [bacterium]HPO51403.1 50S ribosomal protein L29 [bacterium]HXK44952.1 50S ribosomal protein L29 [bacterium]